MKIRAGYEITFNFNQQTPMLCMLNVHPSRIADLRTTEQLSTSPNVQVTQYEDVFGNICTRLVGGPGKFTVSADFVISDSGEPDLVVWDAPQVPVETLPAEVLVYLLGSRYCETDQLSTTAWSLFGGTAPGWPRVQAICDFVHNRIQFGYAFARSTRTALEGYNEGQGVCRDFAHLAVTLCRCMNIPARYCTGYLGDIGVPPVDSPMDFSAWFEAYLGNRWYTFDARHNFPRIGRILMARGRDATDVAISTNFGPSSLAAFFVRTDEIDG